MMKSAGILCILLACAGAGIYAASGLRKQMRQYQLLLSFLKDCEVYIRYQNLPLQELFALLAENPDYQKLMFLHRISTQLSPGKEFETLWSEAVQEIPGEAGRILLNLGHELGRTDVQGQLALLELSQIQMQTACEAHRTGCEKKSRLYQSLGWLGGAMLAILFL